MADATIGTSLRRKKRRDSQPEPAKPDTDRSWTFDAYNEEDPAVFDMKNLRHLKNLDKNAPQAMEAFWAFDKAAFTEGALTAQHKQLIAVAVALTTQCPYCIELHTKAAREAGADDAQLTEAALVAAAIRAGGAVTHSSHLFHDS